MWFFVSWLAEHTDRLLRSYNNAVFDNYPDNTGDVAAWLAGGHGGFELTIGYIVYGIESMGWKGSCAVCGGPMPVNDIHFECY